VSPQTYDTETRLCLELADRKREVEWLTTLLQGSRQAAIDAERLRQQAEATVAQQARELAEAKGLLRRCESTLLNWATCYEDESADALLTDIADALLPRPSSPAPEGTPGGER
jgi:hypothetical protein